MYDFHARTILSTVFVNPIVFQKQMATPCVWRRIQHLILIITQYFRIMAKAFNIPWSITSNAKYNSRVPVCCYLSKGKQLFICVEAIIHKFPLYVNNKEFNCKYNLKRDCRCNALYMCFWYLHTKSAGWRIRYYTLKSRSNSNPWEFSVGEKELHSTYPIVS